MSDSSFLGKHPPSVENSPPPPSKRRSVPASMPAVSGPPPLTGAQPPMASVMPYQSMPQPSLPLPGMSPSPPDMPFGGGGLPPLPSGSPVGAGVTDPSMLPPLAAPKPSGGGAGPLPPLSSVLPPTPSAPSFMPEVVTSPLRSDSHDSTAQLGGVSSTPVVRTDSAVGGHPPPMASSSTSAPLSAMQMHPSPHGADTVPFGLPAHSHDGGLAMSPISQRVMTVTDTKKSRTKRDGTQHERHEHYDAHQAERLAQMRETTATVATRSQSVSLPKQAVKTATYKGMAKDRGLTMTGTNASGFYSKEHSDKIPKYANYQGYRDKQMLSQLSEIMMHSAKQDGLDPVEVQFGYGKRGDGSLDLYASANQAQMQNWLETAMSQPVGVHIKRAANSGDKELEIIADKLLWYQEQTRARTAKFGPGITEDQRRDLNTSTDIFNKFLSRDLTVVKNTEAQTEYARRVGKGLKISKADQTERHAEQNIATAIHTNSAPANPYYMAEVQGSKIRCEGCSSEIGHELVSETGHPFMGKAYPTQSSKPRHGHTLDLVTDHDTHFSTGSNRPRSHSIPNLPAYVPKPPAAGGSSGSK